MTAVLRLETAPIFERTLKAFFSLIVFVVQVEEIIAVGYLLTITVVFCEFINKRRDTWQIIPNRNPRDPHRGFRLFEEPITALRAFAHAA